MLSSRSHVNFIRGHASTQIKTLRSYIPIFINWDKAKVDFRSCIFSVNCWLHQTKAGKTAFKSWISTFSSSKASTLISDLKYILFRSKYRNFIRTSLYLYISARTPFNKYILLFLATINEKCWKSFCRFSMDSKSLCLLTWKEFSKMAQKMGKIS